MQRRLPRLEVPALAQDALLAAFVTVMQVQGTVIRYGDGSSPHRPLGDYGDLGYGLLIVSGAVLVFRRRWPRAVLAVAALASLAYYAVGFHDGPGWLGLFVALYTVTAYGDGRRSVRTVGATVAVLTTGWFLTSTDLHPRAAIGWVFFRIGASVMSAALGESVRGRRVIAETAQQRAELAERTREEEARARVDAERLRIAREVHDTVAHAIAIINVQAGVTAHVLDKRPEQARAALEAIEHTSAQALREMRAILGVLRDAEDERRPAPDVHGVDELAAKARDAGLDVEIESAPPPVPLPSAVATAAFRIVQESLTNVIRHVGPTRVRVRVGYGADAVEVRVVDEGRAGAAANPPNPSKPPPSNHAAGRGIAGMRERCELLGGQLSAGARAGGGFEVLARLPLEPTGAP